MFSLFVYNPLICVWQKPIGSKVRRLAEPKIVLVLNSGSEASTITITRLDELRNFYQPQSPGGQPL